MFRSLLILVDILLETFAHILLNHALYCGFHTSNLFYNAGYYFISEFCPILMIILIVKPATPEKETTLKESELKISNVNITIDNESSEYYNYSNHSLKIKGSVHTEHK